jgi:hypothetical protein
MDKNHYDFLNLSSELTGYAVIDLEGTGLVPLYQNLVENEIGKQVTAFLYDTSKSVFGHNTAEERVRAMRIDIMASPTLWPICKGLIMLWYYGQWTSMSAVWYRYYARVAPGPHIIPNKTIVPSTEAYTQQLSYKAAGAHPPGAHPTGFGSWGLDPVFGDFITTK